MKTKSQDKGHANELAAFVDAISTGTWPISREELIEVSQATLEAANQIRQRKNAN